MRYIGIDFGTKRIGVAVSDADGRMAFARTIIDSSSDVLGALQNIIAEGSTAGIVVGVPIGFSGQESDMADRARAFATTLESLGLPVILENEMLTSSASRTLRPDVGHIDAGAAALMLQGFLDRKERESRK
jgi:putative Holliday junction resolvase